jgi:hypothetical protein
MRLKSFTGIAGGEPMSLHHRDFQLGQNYLNLLNPTMTIEYAIQKGRLASPRSTILPVSL